MGFTTVKALEHLIIELESLLTDIRTIEDVQNSREQNGELTPYVYLENTNLLKKEISGIQWTIRQLTPDHFTHVNDPDSFVFEICKLLDQRHINANMPGAAIYLIKNKLEKVLAFLEHD